MLTVYTELYNTEATRRGKRVMAVPIKTYGRKLISKNTPDI